MGTELSKCSTSVFVHICTPQRLDTTKYDEIR